MHRSSRGFTALFSLTAVLALGACGSSDSAGSSDAPAAPGDPSAYPVTVDTAFGSVKIEEQPERVVTVGFSDQDFTLALGVEPVGVREFLGYDAPNRPWAPDDVRGKDIPTVGAEELNVEKVAALNPDLILGLNAYIDEETYDLLADIAPTVAEAETSAPKWEEQTLTTGKVLGLHDEAQQLVRKTQDEFATARQRHPEFDGTSAAFAFGGAYSLGDDDYRSGWLSDLGFELPATSEELSEERLGPLDRDVLLLEGVGDDLKDGEVFGSLDVVEQNRTVDLGGFGDDFAGALGFNSPLSLPYVLDVAVPRLAAVTDGDPATEPEPYPEN